MTTTLSKAPVKDRTIVLVTYPPINGPVLLVCKEVPLPTFEQIRKALNDRTR